MYTNIKLLNVLVMLVSLVIKIDLLHHTYIAQ